MRSPAKLDTSPTPCAPGTSRGGHPANDDQGELTLARTPLSGGQRSRDAHGKAAPADLDRGHEGVDDHPKDAPVNGHGRVEVDVRSRHAVADNFNGDHRRGGTRVPAVAESAGISHEDRDIRAVTADPADALLGILADKLDDLERVRIANENRLRSLHQVKGLAGTEAEAELAALTDVLVGLEKEATKSLERTMRKHPLGPWVKQTVGLGDKQVARLLASVGDLTVRPVKDEEGNLIGWAPRRVSDLRSYCGLGDPARKRRKGEQANWSNTAKMRAYLCAESCMKQRCKRCTEAAKKGEGWSPPPADCRCAERGFRYRVVFDRERAKWADRDTTDGHRHAHALRVVAKEILKDLWREAQRLHIGVDVHGCGESLPAEIQGQPTFDSQVAPVLETDNTPARSERRVKARSGGASVRRNDA